MWRNAQIWWWIAWIKRFSKVKITSIPTRLLRWWLQPHLSCLADQCNSDPELKNDKWTQFKLLELILEGVKSKEFYWKWKWSFLTMKSSVWIQKVKCNRNFYHDRSNADAFEEILLVLASQALKREIILLPFLQQFPQPEITYKCSTLSSSSKVFYICKKTIFCRTQFFSVLKILE